MNKLIEAIYKLAEVEASTDYPSIFLSGVLAVISSVITVFLVDFLKRRFAEPKDDFKKLRGKVRSMLSLYACYYSNPIDAKMSNEMQIKEYDEASEELRSLAVEVSSFAYEHPKNKFKGIRKADLDDAAALIMCLSNSFFTPYGKVDAENKNPETVEKIKNKLKLI